jgi:sec-independent protein translocase protein TatC
MMVATKTKRQIRQKTAQRAKTPKTAPVTQPFIEHLHELRRRLFYIAASIIFFGGAAYAFENKIIAILLHPAKGQQFIYTSPGGGVDFLFRVCVYVGIALSIPMIVYQVLRYFEPLIGEQSSRFIAWGSVMSGALALSGIVFGYFIGLPNALHFLLHQFVTQQIKPLVTIQSYMAFVAVYMLGSALLFQAPLILLFINRIKPLKPRSLIKSERWVILGAFIIAGLMNPTPNLLAQLTVVAPLLIMYQVGIAIIWYINRKGKKPAFLAELLVQDAEIQAERYEKFKRLRGFPSEKLDTPDLTDVSM